MEHAQISHPAELFDHAQPFAQPINVLEAPHGEWRDCDDLFDTVKSSLWGLIDAPAGMDPTDPAHDGPGLVRLAALRGAIALEKLQTTLTQEFLAREQLEREIGAAREALEQARAELAGTQAQERRANYLATHDCLTELPNRGHFHRQLSHVLGADAPPCQGLALLFVDLDGFKPINDSYGHAAGDELLRIVATRMVRTVRSEDTVGRLGGDEFACMLVGVATSHQAAHLAAKLRDAIQAPCKVGDRMVSVGASVGIAMCPDDGVDADDLLIKADLAMYRAKRQRTGVALYGESADD